MSEPVKEPNPEQKADEQKMVKLYMDMTGCTEASARSVVMHVADPALTENAAQLKPDQKSNP
jgi:hypothetical protein